VDSWNQRLRTAVLRGLAASGEAAAIDEVLTIFQDDSQMDAVISAAASAAAQLGARHLLARDRIRFALERRLDHHSLMIRAAAAKALGHLGDPAARAALATGLGRETFGNIARIFREALEQLGKAAAIITATAELNKRVDELEKSKDQLEHRLEALEKRLDTP
jgi:HEAT repeat protein